jgi:ubiquitin-like protein ATG12
MRPIEQYATWLISQPPIVIDEFATVSTAIETATSTSTTTITSTSASLPTIAVEPSHESSEQNGVVAIQSGSDVSNTNEQSLTPSSIYTTPSTPASFLGLTQLSQTKIILHFRAIGNAPILMKQKIKVNNNSPFSMVIEYLRQCLQYTKSEPLYVFVNALFTPMDNVLINDLFQCYSMNNELNIYYALRDVI